MYKIDGALRLSASDLVRDAACRRLTELNLDVADGRRDAPHRSDPRLDRLVEHGLRHEQDYIEHLIATERQVTQIEGFGFDATSIAATIEAMRGGAEIIIHGALGDERWGGRPDILRRVDRPSRLGDWSYEAIDTKLARETKTGAILQLCLYADLLEAAQGAPPEYMFVVAPWTEFEPQRYRVDDYSAYFRLLRGHLESSLSGGPVEKYPEPVAHCSICRWNMHCSVRRRRDDHLSLVAGIGRIQRDALSSRGVETMADLARLPLPLPWKPERGSRESYTRIREQARLQVESRGRRRPLFEPLGIEDGAGLSLLPQPSTGDIFLAFERAPFAGRDGLEYLISYSSIARSGELAHDAFWARTPTEERRSFEQFVDTIMQRWHSDPDMHIYHYKHDEPSAMKRLMSRYATREDEVDRMLRANLFVELSSVVRRGLRIGTEGYSLNDIEPVFGYEREVPLGEASRAVLALSALLELGDLDAIRSENIDAVERYSRDNCGAVRRLREWLEGIRTDLNERGTLIPRPAPAGDGPSSNPTDWQIRVDRLAERLAGDVPLDPADCSEEQQARWLLAGALDFHRREEKAMWWDFYRLHECSREELLEERSAFAGLRYLGDTGDLPRLTQRYQFPLQETALRGGEDLFVPGDTELKFGQVRSIDPAKRVIEILPNRNAANLHADAVIALNRVPVQTLQHALLRVGDHVAGHGLARGSTYRTAGDLLLRTPPRAGRGPLRRRGETALDAALRISKRRDFGVLPIQGPPGAGKTYAGGQMICELVHQGKRVGITAVSHRVIANLLDAALAAANERSVPLRAIRKISSERSGGESADSRIELTDNNQIIFDRLQNRCQVAAGTAWLWARPDAQDSVDVLFVDEAAQMSLANVLAVSHAAPNMVLLGDPQQLEQPIQGTHPEGVEISALAHLIGERETIEPKRGLFLESTWRLHPDICAFTSELFYEGKLHSRSGLEKQRIVSSGPLNGSGLRYLPVVHRGNRSSSDEEVEQVVGIVESLVGRGSWVDLYGKKRRLGWGDMLIIAPYNAQVFRLQSQLPEAKIGTVDRFQGQEAPIVIYSMATSSQQDAPHGMDFLYSLNRLNVATSRARCVCLLVGSPALFSPECQTPRQMLQANAFCRYRELARQIST